MASVCVGCGLKVEGGVLVADVGGGSSGIPGVGVVCDEDGGLDYAVPLLIARLDDDFVHVVSEFVAGAGVNVASLDPSHWSATYDTADGVVSLGSGGVSVLVDGVYQVDLTGAAIKNPVEDANKLTGGRARINRADVIMSSSGFASYDPEVDFSSTGGSGDGPEWNCGLTLNCVAGQLLVPEVLGQTDADGVDVMFPRAACILTVARLGSARA